MRSTSVPQSAATVIHAEDRYAFDRKVSGIKAIRPLDNQSDEEIPPND